VAKPFDRVGLPFVDEVFTRLCIRRHRRADLAGEFSKRIAAIKKVGRLCYVTGGIANLFPAAIEFARGTRFTGRSRAGPTRLPDMRAANLLGPWARDCR